MKYPKIRTGLLTFILGLMSVPVFTPLFDKWREPYVELPLVESNSPIVVRVCSEESRKFYRKDGYILFKKISDINCNQGGGGGGSGSGDGGRNHEPDSVRYIDDVPAKAKLKSGYRKTKKN